ncbi:MAG: Mur ligase domain-containing protein, partial [bacterium]
MSQVRSATIHDALQHAGILVAEQGVLPQFIDSITDDSRAVQGGGLFLAVRGSERDGHDFLDVALRSGAAVVIVDDPSRTDLPAFVVSDTRRAAAIAAAAFYGEPAKQLRLVG